MKPKISVIIPLYNEEKGIRKTLESLNNQSFKDFEVIVVDDYSKDDSYNVALSYQDDKITVIQNESNKGPAVTRNNGIKSAKADIIAFVDSDAWVSRDWLKNIYEKFQNDKVHVVMGNTKIPKSTYLANSISAQGFPGGANVGFEKMWKVKNGLTNHLTSCNFAIRKEIFDKYGLFDESFPLPGGEDPELAYRINKNSIPINYFSDVLVYHEPMTSFNKWVRWQIKRGRTNYHFKRRIGKIGGFIKLRIWSSWNILKKYSLDIKLPLIFFLLGLSFILQQYGYYLEKK